MGRRAIVVLTGKDANNKKPVRHEFKIFEGQDKAPYEGNGKYLNVTKEDKSWKCIDVRFHKGYDFKATVIDTITESFKGHLIDSHIDFTEVDYIEPVNC